MQNRLLTLMVIVTNRRRIGAVLLVTAVLAAVLAGCQARIDRIEPTGASIVEAPAPSASHHYAGDILGHMMAVVTGYFMLGGLLSILSNTMARRGE